MESELVPPWKKTKKSWQKIVPYTNRGLLTALLTASIFPKSNTNIRKTKQSFLKLLNVQSPLFYLCCSFVLLLFVCLLNSSHSFCCYVAFFLASARKADLLSFPVATESAARASTQKLYQFILLPMFFLCQKIQRIKTGKSFTSGLSDVW